MSEYNIDEVSEFLINTDFEKLNLVINYIVSKEEHVFKDLEILKLISDSSIVSLESKEQLKSLYSKYKKEIEDKILHGESRLPNSISDSEYGLKLKPSIKIDENNAFINLKTTLLIIGLTVLVIIAIAFITLRG